MAAFVSSFVCYSPFLLFPDEPEAKKVASQSERDSAMCMLNSRLNSITRNYKNLFIPVSSHSFLFYVVFLSSLAAIGAQLAALSQQKYGAIYM